MNERRRLVLRSVVAAAVASATPISFVRAASGAGPGPIPKRTVLELADGRRVEINFTGGALMGRVLDAKGRVVSPRPEGALMLKSGKTLVFGKGGRLRQGRIADRAFLLECDPPPAKCPP